MLKYKLITLFILIISISPIYSQSKKGLRLSDGNGKRWAIIIGINEYDDIEIPKLKKAQNDAKGMEQVLKEQGQFNHLYLMTDEQKGDLNPKKKNIERKLKYILDFVEPDDLVLVFFSGHGITDKKKGQGYLIPIDADTNDIYSSSVNVEKIVEGLKKKNVKKSLLILDACRNSMGENQKSLGGLQGLNNKLFTEAEISAIFYSTREGYYSYEDSESNFGVYTRFIIDGIKGMADSRKQNGNEDGIVTFDELEKYVQSNVNEWSIRNNKKQKPFTRIYGESFGSIPVSIYSKSQLPSNKESCEKEGSQWTGTNCYNWSNFMGKMNWEAAKAKCTSIGMRLPSIEELKTAYTTGITETFEWSKDSYLYWSSTSKGEKNAFHMSTVLGHVENHDRSIDFYGVRCIR